MQEPRGIVKERVYMNIAKSISLISILLQFILLSAAQAAVSGASNLDQGWRLWLDPKASLAGRRDLPAGRCRFAKIASESADGRLVGAE